MRNEIEKNYWAPSPSPSPFGPQRSPPPSPYPSPVWAGLRPNAAAAARVPLLPPLFADRWGPAVSSFFLLTRNCVRVALPAPSWPILAPRKMSAQSWG